ncbi:hypothetical protein [Paenibacillus dakarensis]|uniref:hypothetical protein n=1 Tax=Paenibacillus dakarensis TaxID=1527293 RepID=UPI0006D542D1|nr:hypothetical protein [Paenibacillus dakarensis]
MTVTVRECVEQDYVIEQIKQHFKCRVLWCEGRACLEYDLEEELERICDYIKEQFGMELWDVFFTAIESIPEDE